MGSHSLKYALFVLFGRVFLKYFNQDVEIALELLEFSHDLALFLLVLQAGDLCRYAILEHLLLFQVIGAKTVKLLLPLINLASRLNDVLVKLDDRSASLLLAYLD